MLRIIYSSYITICLILSTYSMAQSSIKVDDLFSMSLEDLMNVKVSTGSLLNNSTDQAPVAITVIQRDQIDISGAKNLADLLENYVPGMIVMSHSEGDKIGLRGLIAAENYKLLLLINGKNITNMAYEGAILEIDQWEMGDIEKVEVIRGPGSVTYGTGAIAGIINIITKTAKNNLPTFSVGITRNDTYESNGVNLQYADHFNELSLYTFASYRQTNGLNNPNYYALSPAEASDIRYIGKRSIDNIGPQNYLADGNERPQIKAHIGLSYGDNFNSWLRFTQSGQTKAYTTMGNTIDQQGNIEESINKRSTGIRSLAFSSDYKYSLSTDSNLKASLTIDSQEYIRWDLVNPTFSPKTTENIIDYAFSQDRVNGSLLYDYNANDDFNFVIGYEYSNIHIGAPWHKNNDHLLIQEGGHIISHINTSVYLQDRSINNRPNVNNVIEVGSGIKTETHSHLLEARYQLTDQHQLFYAHRFDIPDISENMFSPRVSLVSNINKTNTWVTTAQRAQRMMPLRAQYLNYLDNGKSSSHETLDSLEISYTNRTLMNSSINVRAFYNDISAVGYTGEKLEFLTDIELYGIELIATYKMDNFQLMFNHSYLDTINVKMNDELKTGDARNNISYADYYYNTRSNVPILLESYGDGLNNWSKNTSKFSITNKYLDERLTAELNTQVFWDADGSYDEMIMYQQAYDNFDTSALSSSNLVLFEQQKKEFNRERKLLEDTGAYKIDYNVNASIRYLWSLADQTKLTLKLFAENIFSSKRIYNVSTGSNRFYPERLSFMEEPNIYGLSLTISYK